MSWLVPKLSRAVALVAVSVVLVAAGVGVGLGMVARMAGAEWALVGLAVVLVYAGYVVSEAADRRAKAERR